MKKIAAVFALVVISFFAYSTAIAGMVGLSAPATMQFHTANTASISTPGYNQLCMNYDTSVILTGSFSTTTVTSDLQEIQGRGINCIRDIGFYNATSSNGVQTWMYQTGQIAHTLGMTMHCANQGVTVTSSNEALLLNAFIADVNAGQGYCDSFDMVNEQSSDGTTVTGTQLMADLKTTATTIKSQAIYTGNLDIALVNNSVDTTDARNYGTWISSAVGGTVPPFDQVCVNIYAAGPSNPYLSLKNYIATFMVTFPNGCITEWNITGTWSQTSAFTSAKLQLACSYAMQAFRDSGFQGQAFYFTYKTNSSFAQGADAFAVALQAGGFTSCYGPLSEYSSTGQF